MYFMFQNVPHTARRAVAVQQRVPDHAGRVPAHRDVPDHVDNDAARTGFGNVGAHPDHAAAPARPARRLRHRVLDRRRGAGHAGLPRVVSGSSASTPRAARFWVFTIAIINAVLGVGLGLLCSAFARTEFQAVQFMPVVIAPQLLLCGHHRAPRRAAGLAAVDQQCAARQLRSGGAAAGRRVLGARPDIAVRDIAVVIGFAVVALCLAAATLRRRTP